ncbi:MAG: helix-turn-helix domain-containing protein [Treponema sp.]|nr:helix-turn-helix domain-containing protein [Treponema sp.]
MDLRTILAENLRNTRKALRISRAKLAENAGVSVPYLADIERRRTWVSDKTLQNLAEALNLEPYELLCAGLENKLGQNKASRMQMAEIVTKKKNILRKTMENVMEDLILELVKKEK